MRYYLLIFSSCIFLIASCDSNRSSISNNNEVHKKLAGAYVRDYSFEVKNMSTNHMRGIRNIRDANYIKEKKRNGLILANAKYQIIYYDQDGWLSIGGTERIPTF
jgi:hypothetical protein